MKFEFNQNIKPICSDDVYYDLFLGGYLRPEELLSNVEDIEKVNHAIKIIEAYISQATEAGLIEEE